MYRDTPLGICLRDLHYWNAEAYEEGYRSQYLDDEGVQWNGMRTDQLALWIMDKREDRISDIQYISRQLGVDIVAIVQNRDHLDKFIDTRDLTDADIRKLTKQLEDNQRELKQAT